MKRNRHPSSSDDSDTGSTSTSMSHHSKTHGRRCKGKKPSEVFRTDLITAMKLHDTYQLSPEDYYVLADAWRQEWEKGVQVPVSPDSVPHPVVRTPCERPGAVAIFSRPKKLIRSSGYEPPVLGYVGVRTLAEGVCRYDLDEQDVAWLSAANAELEHMGLPALDELSMERIMEELERWCYDSLRHAMETEEGLGIEYDEDVVCDVCQSPDGEDGNEMVFCDKCNICVHQACYGILKVPSGSWLCRICALGISPRCQLCPKRGGAMKPTRSGTKWVHVSCALWIPEVSIGNPEKMEPITNISHIPSNRLALSCCLCKDRSGACIQCSAKSCRTAFHVTCGQRGGLKMRTILTEADEVKFKSYCPQHSGLKPTDVAASDGSQDNPGTAVTTESEMASGSVAKDMKKLAAAAGRKGSGGRKPRDPNQNPNPNQHLRPAPDPPHSRSGTKVSSASSISAASAGCLSERKQRLLQLEDEFYRLANVAETSRRLGLTLPEEAVDLVYQYWKLKRRANHNQPLVTPKREEEESLARREQEVLLRRLRLFTHLRQDLERVRNLTYMVTRREKIKRSVCRVQEQIFQQHIRLLEQDRFTGLSNTRRLSEAQFYFRDPAMSSVPYSSPRVLKGPSSSSSSSSTSSTTPQRPHSITQPPPMIPTSTPGVPKSSTSAPNSTQTPAKSSSQVPSKSTQAAPNLTQAPGKSTHTPLTSAQTLPTKSTVQLTPNPVIKREKQAARGGRVSAGRSSSATETTPSTHTPTSTPAPPKSTTQAYSTDSTRTPTTRPSQVTPKSTQTAENYARAPAKPTPVDTPNSAAQVSPNPVMIKLEKQRVRGGRRKRKGGRGGNVCSRSDLTSSQEVENPPSPHKINSTQLSAKPTPVVTSNSTPTVPTRSAAQVTPNPVVKLEKQSLRGGRGGSSSKTTPTEISTKSTLMVTPNDTLAVPNSTAQITPKLVIKLEKHSLRGGRGRSSCSISTGSDLTSSQEQEVSKPPKTNGLLPAKTPRLNGVLAPPSQPQRANDVGRLPKDTDSSLCPTPEAETRRVTRRDVTRTATEKIDNFRVEVRLERQNSDGSSSSSSSAIVTPKTRSERQTSDKTNGDIGSISSSKSAVMNTQMCMRVGDLSLGGPNHTPPPNLMPTLRLTPVAIPPNAQIYHVEDRKRRAVEPSPIPSKLRTSLRVSLDHQQQQKGSDSIENMEEDTWSKNAASASSAVTTETKYNGVLRRQSSGTESSETGSSSSSSTRAWGSFRIPRKGEKTSGRGGGHQGFESAGGALGSEGPEPTPATTPSPVPRRTSERNSTTTAHATAPTLRTRVRVGVGGAENHKPAGGKAGSASENRPVEKEKDSVEEESDKEAAGPDGKPWQGQAQRLRSHDVITRRYGSDIIRRGVLAS
ncbi:protein Jade-1 isoform X2 [Engraulis encrasicolus]|uniref:protein Jade-1 isoform X2 n=1 Tax=Engraulis encrasicolus TaxID=184585 RepID=UPI002FD32015